MKQNELIERLSTTLQNLEKMTNQLRQTQDYSMQSEVFFLLHELVLEQTGSINENSSHSAHTPG